MPVVVANAPAWVIADPFVGADGFTPESIADDELPSLTFVSSARGLSYPDWTVQQATTGTGEDEAPIPGVYKFMPDAGWSDVDRVTVTLNGVAGGAGQTITVVVDVVGARVITAAEAKAAANLADSIPLTTVQQMLDTFLAQVEEYRDVAYVLRLDVQSWRGWPRSHAELRMALPSELVSVTAGDTAITDAVLSGEVVYRTSRASLTSYTDTLLTITYVHGHERPPVSLRRAAVNYVRATLNADASSIPKDAFAISVDGISYRLSTPDWANGRPFGFQDVDAIVNALPYRKRAR